MIKKAYVIGNNTQNSLSPTIFNYWFQKYKVDAEYNYIEIKEENFHKEIKTILKIPGMCGFNVTVPFKEKIIPFLSEIDDHSSSIGAVNFVTKKNTKFCGGNTDWLGFQNSIFWLESINDLDQIKLKKKSAIVVGYGGSAKATIYALEKMGFSKVSLWNRSFNKIKNLTNLGFLKITPSKLEKNNFIIDLDTDLIINTIPTNNFYTAIKQDMTEIYKKKIYGYDLVYNTTTNFLDLFSSSYRINGINLLVHQAAPCFEQWFSIKPDIDQSLFDLLYQKLRAMK